MEAPSAPFPSTSKAVNTDDGPSAAEKLAYERRERRMRNEYERTARVLGDLVNDNLEAPYRLSAVRYQDDDWTRRSFLSQVCQPFIDGTQPGLRSLLQTSRSIASSLAGFGIFSDVQATLERSPDMLAEEGDVDLVLKLKEAPRMFLKAGTDVGNSEGSATFTARLRNVFGGAETLEANAAFGTRTRSNIQARFETPIPGRPTPETRLEISGSATERDLTHFASCKEHVRGGGLKLRTRSRYGFHELAYDLFDRHITDLEPHASLSMRRSAGHTVKSALSHTFLLYEAMGRDQVKLVQEYAGLGGDAQHVKVTADAHTARTYGGATVTAALRSGLLCPLGGGPSLFSDRFQLGGPTSVRAFKVNGVGPKDNGDFLGGDLTWSAGLSVFHAIPRREHWPIQLHTFVNAGRLAAWRTDRSVAQNVEQLVKRPVASAGLGLAYSNGPIRLELNFALPLAASSSDATRKGFNVGLGIEFL